MRILKPQIRVKPLFPFIVLMFYPLLVLIIVGGFIIPEFKSYIKEIVDTGLCSFILLTLALFRPRKIVPLFFAFLMATVVLVKLSFYHHYGVKISPSAMFVIFETNSLEASDFMIHYFDGIVMGLLIALTAPIPFIYSLVNKKLHFRLKGIVTKVLALVLIGFSGYCLTWKFKKENGLLVMIDSYRDYTTYKGLLENQLAKPQSDAFGTTSFSDEPQTHIIIIGESTSRWHMQLYGYERETNPLLNQMKDELLVFDSVIAPNVHTILSLDKILTLSDHKNPQKQSNGSIVQLANQSGFDTYWLSNQRPMGFHESIATLIGSASKQSYFMNSEDYMDTIYDENIFPTLDMLLSEPNPKKLIFIHLIGTHIDYQKRYPKHFEYFKDLNRHSEFATEKNKDIINEYDNAVRYNDFIVSTIIEKARQTSAVGYVVYLSDHGDEVYDTMDLIGHNEYHGTRPMYEVPFIVWMSENYKNQYSDFKELNQYTDRPYNLEHFIHSFSNLTRIRFEGYDERKSIFSSDFEKTTRWIKEKVDYDNR